MQQPREACQPTRAPSTHPVSHPIIIIQPHGSAFLNLTFLPTLSLCCRRRQRRRRRLMLAKDSESIWNCKELHLGIREGFWKSFTELIQSRRFCRPTYTNPILTVGRNFEYAAGLYVLNGIRPETVAIGYRSLSLSLSLRRNEKQSEGQGHHLTRNQTRHFYYQKR